MDVAAVFSNWKKEVFDLSGEKVGKSLAGGKNHESQKEKIHKLRLRA